MAEEENLGRSEKEIERIIKESGIPSPPELGKPGSYIQTTVQAQVLENRKKNDIVLIPVGCTENHGRYTISGLDNGDANLRSCPALYRKARLSCGFSPPTSQLWCYPYHHIGVPGTVIHQSLWCGRP